MSVELVRFATDVELAKQAASDWLTHLRAEFQCKAGQPFSYSVALSGGRITKTFFNELVKQIQATPAGLEPAVLEGIHFFWADERCVPPNDPECNYAIAKQLLFEPLGIAASKIHRLRGEGVESEALAEAISDLKLVAQIENGIPKFDLVLLGMGEDGHTASLFPGESEAVMSNPAIYRAVTAVKPPPRRITLGFSTIIVAKNVWVLASGAGKEESFKKTLTDQELTPLGRILHRRNSSKVLTDIKS